MTPWTGGLPALWGGQGARDGLQAIKDARWRKATGLVAAGGRKALRLYAAEKGCRGGHRKAAPMPAGTASAPHVLPAERGPGGDPLDRRTVRLRRAGGPAVGCKQ